MSLVENKMNLTLLCKVEDTTIELEGHLTQSKRVLAYYHIEATDFEDALLQFWEIYHKPQTDSSTTLIAVIKEDELPLFLEYVRDRINVK
jgi:hypothetical protein